MKITNRGQAYPFEQFDLQLHRPDIGLSRIGYAPKSLIESYARLYRSRLERMGFESREFKPDFHLPVVKFPKTEPSTSERRITLQIVASDEQLKLDRLLAWVNDVPVGPIKGLSLDNRNSRTASMSLEFPLMPGPNKIQVSVVNSNNVESHRETREIECTAPSVKPDLCLVAVGASAYTHTQFDSLPYAAKDARDLAAFMEKLAERVEYEGRTAPQPPRASARPSDQPAPT